MNPGQTSTLIKGAFWANWRVRSAAVVLPLSILLSIFFLVLSVGGAAAAPKVIYPKKSRLDLDAMKLEGEIKNPSDFYFQYKPEQKADTLVKRRPHFHRELLRDAVLIK